MKMYKTGQYSLVHIRSPCPETGIVSHFWFFFVQIYPDFLLIYWINRGLFYTSIMTGQGNLAVSKKKKGMIMKNPFDVFLQRKQQIENKKTRLQQEITDLEEREKQLEEKAKAAAVNDDLDSYMQIGKEKERTAAAIELKKVQLESVEQVPESEVLEGWREYAAGHDKELSKALEDVEKAKAALCDTYRNLLIVQNNGLIERRRVGALLGFGAVFRSVPGGGESLESKLPLKTIPQQAERPVSYRGRNMRSDLALYLSEHPESEGMKVVSGYEPVERGKI